MFTTLSLISSMSKHIMKVHKLMWGEIFLFCGILLASFHQKYVTNGTTFPQHTHFIKSHLQAKIQNKLTVLSSSLVSLGFQFASQSASSVAPKANIDDLSKFLLSCKPITQCLLIHSNRFYALIITFSGYYTIMTFCGMMN